MVAKKKYTPRKRKVSRKPSSTRAIARQECKKILGRNLEVKTNSVKYNEAVLSTLTPWASMTLMNGIPDGDASIQRVGNEVRMIGSYMNGIVKNSSDVDQTLRIVLFYYYGEDTLSTDTFNMFRDGANNHQDFTVTLGLATMWQRISKWKINKLYDKVITIGRQGGDHSSVRLIRHFTKLYNKKVTFQSGAEDNPNPRLILWMGSAEQANDTTVGENLEVSLEHVLYYTDL